MLRLDLAPGAPSALLRAAMRYFDDDLIAVRGMEVELPAFIEHARRLDPAFTCTPEALDFILEERDRQRRTELSRHLADADISSVINAPLQPYQLEAVRFIFHEGRALLADEPGLGKLTEAVATIELFKARNMASTALIICPTSLKYQWAKEIERLTGLKAIMLEGPHDVRRPLYADQAPYRIVSYHTLANDIKALGSIHADIAVFDQLQRLRLWHPHISNAARRVDSDFAIGLSPTPADDILQSGIYSFVDPDYDETSLKHHILRRCYREVSEQVPRVIDKAIFVPMTKEQRAIHDSCRDDVSRITDKWQKLRFLSEKERKRLLKLLSTMRMSCASTALIDPRTRSDTKIAEAVQYVEDMSLNGASYVVVFTHWSAIARMLDISFEHKSLSDKVRIISDADIPGAERLPADLVLHVDVPWNGDIIKRRMSRVEPHAGCRVITLVSAGSIEESMYTLLSTNGLPKDSTLENGLDGLTLTDSKLDAVTAILSRLLADNTGSPTGSLIGGNEQESLADDGMQSIPEPSALISAGVNFLDGLANTLRSPEATERLLDAITSDTDGRTELHIPVSRQTLTVLLRLLAAKAR